MPDAEPPAPLVPLARLARGPVLGAAGAVALVLTATSGGYGYHRDELYFRMLEPAWGYVDQPPLVPLLARATALVADEAWALRIPATLATAAVVVVLALVTREAGGGRGAQALCAWGAAFGSMPLVFGHVLLTATLDALAWTAALLLVVRAQLRDRPAWWLAAGAVVGLASWTKLLVIVLVAAVAVGVLLVGPRRLLVSRWVLGAGAVALVVASPNIAYQAANSWSQLEMGAALSEGNAGEVRVQMWWFLAVLLGPPLVPVWLAGLVAAARRPAWRPVRFLAAALPVLLALVFALGSQPYYPFGLVAVLFALGCVPVAAWAGRGGTGRRALVVGGVALNAAVSAVIALPLVPVSLLGGTPVPDVNQVARDSVGWPTYVAQVARAVDALPPAERARAVVVATNYGEAGALDRYGPDHDLPPVVSGHNALADRGAPPASADVAVVVGEQAERAPDLFATCETVGRLGSGLGVDTEEEGQPIAVCREPVGGWDAVWPALRHLD